MSITVGNDLGVSVRSYRPFQRVKLLQNTDSPRGLDEEEMNWLQSLGDVMVGLVSQQHI